MDSIIFWVLIGIAAIALYMALLASFLVLVDPELPPIQKVTKCVLAWLVPFVGPAMVLHLVADHSPELIRRLWIPWPFRKAIHGTPYAVKPKPDDSGMDFWTCPGGADAPDIADGD